MDKLLECEAVGFYDRLRLLAKAGKWDEALALMRRATGKAGDAQDGDSQ